MKRISFLVAVFFASAVLIHAQDVRKEFYGMWTIDIEDGSATAVPVRKKKVGTNVFLGNRMAM